MVHERQSWDESMVKKIYGDWSPSLWSWFCTLLWSCTARSKCCILSYQLLGHYASQSSGFSYQVSISFFWITIFRHFIQHLRFDHLECSTGHAAACSSAAASGDGLIRQEKWPEAFEVIGLGQPPDHILEDREEDGSPWAPWHRPPQSPGAMSCYFPFIYLLLTRNWHELANINPLITGHSLDIISRSPCRVHPKEWTKQIPLIGCVSTQVRGRWVCSPFDDLGKASHCARLQILRGWWNSHKDPKQNKT